MNLIEKLKNIVKKEDEKLIFKEIANEWLETKKITIKESTYYNYVYFINKYIINILGSMTIEELQNYNFNEFITELMKTLSNKTLS